jgi:dipeptidyl aminopeptidase/acylaminoacyl peptidase
LLTFVHGGPASRFDQSFLGYLGNVYATQALAAKGYAILRPNPRGSNGYGAAFRRANMRDWGGMDWLDVNAGIDKLIADGIADPKRLGLMGWSYGGYLGGWALAQSDRFAAVSVGAGMSDLLMMQATSDTHGYVAAYFPGMPLDLLRERSPAWQLKKKPNAKILIQQGENDERVPLAQGTLLYRRLLDLGADVTMVTYPRSGHSIREPRLRLDVMKRNVELFTSAVPAAR